MTAKQRKTLPAHEPIHEEIYQDFLVRYGYNTQPKIEKVNRAWLTYFHVENTVKNRESFRLNNDSELCLSDFQDVKDISIDAKSCK